MSHITFLIIQEQENETTEVFKAEFPIEIFDNRNKYEIDNYQGIIICGGKNITTFESEELKNLIFSLFKQKKPVIAMDCGPVILANMGFLVGKCVTVNDEYGRYVHSKGAIIFDDSIVIDKNLITTRFKVPETELLETIKQKKL
ncbi:MAG: DJ-1/PfpI family protein [Nanoarchaeota archaeon]